MISTQQPPYYAVIFTSLQTANTEGYTEMAEQMEALAKAQSGFLGMVSARSHLGITVSYWASLKAIAQWKAQADHQWAQQKGKKEWYAQYRVDICKVERSYQFDKNE